MRMWKVGVFSPVVCRSSSHKLMWGNCSSCFHFLLFPFLFPPPPVKTKRFQFKTQVQAGSLLLVKKRRKKSTLKNLREQDFLQPDRHGFDLQPVRMRHSAYFHTLDENWIHRLNWDTVHSYESCSAAPEGNKSSSSGYKITRIFCIPNGAHWCVSFSPASPLLCLDSHTRGTFKTYRCLFFPNASQWDKAPKKGPMTSHEKTQEVAIPRFGHCEYLASKPGAVPVVKIRGPRTFS